MKIKTTVRYHFIPARMVTIKKKEEGGGRKEGRRSDGRDVK